MGLSQSTDQKQIKHQKEIQVWPGHYFNIKKDQNVYKYEEAYLVKTKNGRWAYENKPYTKRELDIKPYILGPVIHLKNGHCVQGVGRTDKFGVEVRQGDFNLNHESKFIFS